LGFVLTVALRTKSSLPNKFLRNRGIMPMMSTLVLSTSEKHATGSLEKSFGQFCRNTCFTTCHWPITHCKPAQKFVPVPVALNHNRSPWVMNACKGVRLHHFFHSTVYMNRIDSHSRVDRGCHCWELQDQPFALCRRFAAACIFSTGPSMRT